MGERRAISGLRVSRQDMSILIRGETIDVAPHSHHALQISIGLDGAFDFECASHTVRAEGVVARSDIPHRLDSRGMEVAVLLLEPEEVHARRIGMRWLENKAFVTLPPHIVGAARALLAGPGLKQASIPNDLMRELVPDMEPSPPMDARIASLLERLRETPGSAARLRDLAKETGLSESRLTHLFKEQTGVPIRRYLLWLRLNDAMDRAMAGATLTEAAHAAGFSDSAHLSRTCQDMFGINPFAVVRHSQFIQVPKGGGA